MTLRDEVESALRETGLPWSVDPGSRHLKVKLAGRLVGIMPKKTASTDDRRAWLNLRSQIRRAEKVISCRN